MAVVTSEHESGFSARYVPPPKRTPFDYHLGSEGTTPLIGYRTVRYMALPENVDLGASLQQPIVLADGGLIVESDIVTVSDNTPSHVRAVYRHDNRHGQFTLAATSIAFPERPKPDFARTKVTLVERFDRRVPNDDPGQLDAMPDRVMIVNVPGDEQGLVARLIVPAKIKDKLGLRAAQGRLKVSELSKLGFVIVKRQSF